jgi:putative CocE/NonD family hydrolase
MGRTGEVSLARDVEVVVRDGTVLRADVYQPAGEAAVPAIVQRTPYDKSLYDAAGRAYAERGYLVVVQDVRGQFASDGAFEPWVNEGTDGYDTIEWVAAQPGCTGKVGTAGTSYQAVAQWQAACLRPPHLTAMATPVTPADYYDQWVYPGGAFALSFNTTWLLNNVGRSAVRRLPGGTEIADAMEQAYAALPDGGFTELPLSTFAALRPHDRRVAPYFFDWLSEHAERDDYWNNLSLRNRYDAVQVPVLSYEGWYDVFVDGGIENFAGMQADGGTAAARTGSRLVVGPYAHNNWGRQVGDVDFGSDADDTYFAVTLAWFDHWLKGEGSGLSAQPPVRYFTMGANVWNAADSWPPPGHAPTSLYLASSGGGANGLAGGGELAAKAGAGDRTADTFTYDPAEPVPSIGGNGCCYPPQSPMGPYDQRAVELRSDVLVYTGPQLSRALEVTGTATVTLWAASSAPATDFTAKLVDVHPDGNAINICGGIVRTAMPAGGQPARLSITLSATSIAFLPGHRVRLEISSSNFPLYDRNPNTGLPPGSSTRLCAAQQTVLHSAAYPSHLTLPVKGGAVAHTEGRPDPAATRTQEIPA